MPQQQNVESVRAFFDRVLNGGDVASLQEFVHQDVVVPESSGGLDGMRRRLAALRASFANPEYKIVETVSEGERVVVRFSAKATNSGDYMGLPATGHRLSLWGVMLFGFDAGAISEFWMLVDSQGILKQLRDGLATPAR